MPQIYLEPERSASTPVAVGSSTAGAKVIHDQCELAINAIAFDYHLLYSTAELKKNSFININANDTPKPVIRIYGSLSSGQKACMNVHGMLPYLYFRPLDPLETLFDDGDKLPWHMNRFHKHIENYLEFKRNEDMRETCRKQGREYRKSATRRHIESMEIVSTKSVYGFHSQESLFIKVTYINPSDLIGILHILEGGFLGHVVMQAYESHIPYMLKFLMDYNVQPMGWLYASDVRFRQPLPTSVYDSLLPPPALIESMGGAGDEAMSSLPPTDFPSQYRIYTQSSTPADRLWGDEEVRLVNASAAAAATAPVGGEDRPLQLKCQCTTGLEIDIHVDHILNAKIRPHKFGEELWEEEGRRRELRRLPEDRIPSQPSTQTSHLAMGAEGALYQSQLKMMARKGRLLIVDGSSSLPVSQASLDESGSGLGLGGSSVGLQRSHSSTADCRMSCSAEQGLQLQQDSPEEQALFEWLQSTQRVDQGGGLAAAAPDGEADEEDSMRIIYASQQSEEEGAVVEDSSDEEGEGEGEAILSSQDGVDDPGDRAGSKRGAEKGGFGDAHRKKQVAIGSPFSWGSQGLASQASTGSSGGSRSRRASRASARGYGATGSGVLIPTLTPPLPADVLGQPFTVNPPLHFSDHRDYLAAFGGAAGVASRDFLLRRHESDGLGPVAAFHQGDALAAALAGCRDDMATSCKGGNSSSRNKAGIAASIATTSSSAPAGAGSCCCLLPSFAPPDPHGEGVASFTAAAIKCAVSQADQIRTVSPTAAPGVGRKHAMDNGSLPANDTTAKARVTIMSFEILSYARDDEVSHPDKDPVLVVAWAVDDSMSSAEQECTRRVHGVLYLLGERHGNLQRLQTMLKAEASLGDCTRVTIVHSEEELLLAVARTVRMCDPDILLGYEVQNSSLGYLVHRARRLGMDLLAEMSRFPHEPSHRPSELDKYSEENLCDIFIVGRIVLNVWRLLKREMKVYSYFQSNIAQELLGQTAPHYTCKQLNRWYRNALSCGRPAVHVLRLATLNLDFLHKLDLVRRTAESARLYGIDFTSVLTRGSQFRVEAALTRRAHRAGFITASPNKLLVANQAAITAIPLVAEPRSTFYADPVIVLDFTSLYPSMIIAHNLCYSTIIAKLDPSTADPRKPSTSGRLGVFAHPEAEACAAVHAHSLVDGGAQPFISPNGAVFCDKKVLVGVLPLMLKEILDTRQMIKRSMKAYGGDGDALLRRSLDARQMAIKLLSNVTYGYTAASYSGRMPMAELADAIVSTGRATLEAAMAFIGNSAKWNAEVVYGDTDSLFVLLRGRSKDDALRIGNEMALEVTRRCLPGVELKFEKVYYPCILVTKKRYCGSAWERLGQGQPHFEAKGIECIRSDQCLATAKLQERALRMLFETRDVSSVKAFLVGQWTKLLKGADRINVRDFIFYKNVKTGHYKPGATLPPAAELVSSLVAQRRMRVPPYKWRVPYVVVYGAGRRLIDLVVPPEALLQRGGGLKVNIEYYITKCINPALQRVLGLCGAAVRIEDWYAATPKPSVRLRRVSYEGSASAGGGVAAISKTNNQKKNQQTLDLFTFSSVCELCGGDAKTSSLCSACASEPSTLLLLQDRLGSLEAAEQALRRMCDSCAAGPQRSVLLEKGQMIGPDACSAISCPVFFERCKVIVRMEDAMESLCAVEAVSLSW